MREPQRHVGPVEAKYHHIGSGATRSDFFCKVCDGWFGVPHDGSTHDHIRPREDCACVSCQTHYGVFPGHGTFATHGEYIDSIWPLINR